MSLYDPHHLETVNETYWQHLRWCLYSTGVFLIMIPLAVVHGLFPFLLANVPDRVMVTYLRNFKARRITTGQADRSPE